MGFHSGGWGSGCCALVSLFRRDGVLGQGQQQPCDMLGGPKGEAVALRIAKGIRVLPCHRGQALVGRALLPKTREAPQLLTLPRSCGLQDAMGRVHAHTHTHAAAHTLAHSVHLPEGKNRGGEQPNIQQTPTRPHHSSAQAAASHLHSQGYSSAKPIMPQGGLSSRPSPGCPLPGGPEGGWQWGLHLPSALPSPSLARECTLLPCGLQRPSGLWRLRLLPWGGAQSPAGDGLTIGVRKEVEGQSVQTKMKHRVQSSASSPPLPLGLTPLSSPTPCRPLGFGPATIRKQQQAGDQGAPGPGGTAGSL